jgi:hypothetical protein
LRRERRIGAARDGQPAWSFLGRLNGCREIGERYATALRPSMRVAAEQRSSGAPEMCYVLSATAELDGLELPLHEAHDRVEMGGCGTLVGCTRDRLAYFYDEGGERRWLLER